MPPSTIRLQLELAPGVDPIRGIVRHVPNGDPMPFTGWLQLTEILEAIRRSATGAQVPDDAR